MRERIHRHAAIQRRLLLWVWTKRWQDSEREAIADLERGNFYEFESGAAAEAWLLRDLTRRRLLLWVSAVVAGTYGALLAAVWILS